jgi:hypothetical protein
VAARPPFSFEPSTAVAGPEAALSSDGQCKKANKTSLNAEIDKI